METVRVAMLVGSATAVEESGVPARSVVCRLDGLAVAISTESVRDLNVVPLRESADSASS